MNLRNFLKAELLDEVNSHDGEGTVKSALLFNSLDFNTPVRFMYYTILPPASSIGIHEHRNDEEFYIILDGTGVMYVDGEDRAVSNGDIIVNKPFGSHGLKNNSDRDLKLLVFEVGKEK